MSSPEKIGQKVISLDHQYVDTRSEIRRFKDDILGDRTVGLVIAAIFFLVIALIPGLSHFSLILTVLLYFLTNAENKTMRPPLMLPKSSGLLDDNNKVAGPNSDSRTANGAVFLGNDPNRNNAEIWVSIEQATRHLEMIATTGSGKTEYLMAIYFSILCHSSAIIDIDGKSSASTARQFQNLVRRFGREDDLFYFNLQTAGVDANKYYRTSNNTNPISSSNAQGASLLITGLLPESKGENQIFAQRAATLGEITTNILYDKQTNTHDYTVSLSDYDDAMQLSSLMEVLKEKWLEPTTKKQILSYLQSLQVDSPENAKFKNLQSSTIDQHLYATMYFTRALNAITGTYGNILNTRYGDFTWYDVVNRHRIIKTMLPTLEKSKQEKDYLTNLIITMLKQTTSRFLDFKIAGPKAYTAYLPHDHTLSVITLDEANYLLTDGIGVMAGQIRQLGFCLIVSGQSLAAMRDAHPREMKEVEANTGLKLYGALEDQEAIDDAIKRAGDVNVKVVSAYKGDSSKGYWGDDTVRSTKEKAIDVSHVKGQTLSQWFLSYKNNPIQVISFYVPELSNMPDETRINEFTHRFDEHELPHFLLRKLENKGDSKPKKKFTKKLIQKEGVFTFNQYMSGINEGVPSTREVMTDIVNAKLDVAISQGRDSSVSKIDFGHLISGSSPEGIYANTAVNGDEEILLQDDSLEQTEIDDIDEHDDFFDS